MGKGKTRERKEFSIPNNPIFGKFLLETNFSKRMNMFSGFYFKESGHSQKYENSMSRIPTGVPCCPENE
jgi:hypothetical protein